MEKRYLELKDIECSANDDKSLGLAGYAIKFNEPSGLLYGEFIEKIDARALDGVDISNVFMLYNHNSDYVLGNTRSSTLTLSVTEVGLRFSVDLPNTAKAKEIHELVKRGDINGMSFGFTVNEETWNMESDPIIRTINMIGELKEISIVPFPAYEQTEVEPRTLEYLSECKSCRKEVREILTNPLMDEVNKILKEVKNEN